MVRYLNDCFVTQLCDLYLTTGDKGVRKIDL